MAAKIIRLSDFQDSWKEVFTAFSGNSTMHVHSNARTGEASITIVDDDGEAKVMNLTMTDAVALVEILGKSQSKVGT
jgi:hypothetical protein